MVESPEHTVKVKDPLNHNAVQWMVLPSKALAPVGVETKVIHIAKT